MVTGLGVASCLGCEVPALWQAIQRGESGIRQIPRFRDAGFPVSIAGAVADEALGGLADDPEVAAHRALLLGLWATDRAWRDSGLERSRDADELDPRRVGICVGVGGFPALEEIVAAGAAGQQSFEPGSAHAASGGADEEEGGLAALWRRAHQRRPELFSQFRLADVTEGLGDRVGARGPRLGVQCACASSAVAVGEAAARIRDGDLDVVVSGGADSMLSIFPLLGFDALGALSRWPDAETASKPFDARRDGFVLSEGAGILILEEAAHASRRGARVLAEVVGSASANDAYRFTDVHPEALGATACMRGALEDAGLEPEAIDYLSAHGTSTVQNDELETAAIERVFGDHVRRLLVSSSKSQLGHLLCAAGGVELVLVVLALRDGVVPPTINLERPDPSCALDYVAQKALRRPLRRALSNSFGFGGQCGSVILERWPA